MKSICEVSEARSRQALRKLGVSLVVRDLRLGYLLEPDYDYIYTSIDVFEETIVMFQWYRNGDQLVVGTNRGGS